MYVLQNKIEHEYSGHVLVVFLNNYLLNKHFRLAGSEDDLNGNLRLIIAK